MTSLQRASRNPSRCWREYQCNAGFLRGGSWDFTVNKKSTQSFCVELHPGIDNNMSIDKTRPTNPISDINGLCRAGTQKGKQFCLALFSTSDQYVLVSDGKKQSAVQSHLPPISAKCKASHERFFCPIASSYMSHQPEQRQPPRLSHFLRRLVLAPHR